MSYNIRYNTTTGQIISAGFCDFTAQLKSGEAQMIGPIGTIPADITTAYSIVNGELTNTPPPPPTPTLDQQLMTATNGLVNSKNAASFYVAGCAAYKNLVPDPGGVVELGKTIASIYNDPTKWPWPPP